MISIKSAVCGCYEDVSLLDEWYILDEQSIPSSYLLQPARSHFPHLDARLGF